MPTKNKVVICDCFAKQYDISDDDAARAVMRLPFPPEEVLYQMTGYEHLSEETRMLATRLYILRQDAKSAVEMIHLRQSLSNRRR